MPDTTEPCHVATEPPRNAFPTWEEFFSAYLLWPVIVQIVLSVILTVLSIFYTHAYNRRRRLYNFVNAYIGTQENMRVKYPVFIVLCYILQMLLSITSVVLFVHRLYTREVSEFGHTCQIVVSVFFTFYYFICRMQSGFSLSDSWSLSAVVDTFTVVPVLLPAVTGLDEIPAHAKWLSLTYLRSYRALLAYQKLERTVGLGEVSEYYRRVLLSLMRTATVVICMGCTVLILEVLGEIPSFEDKFIATGMGDLSFVQMFYWMFTTISTVGYGDFSPTTAPSRLFIIVCIISGIAFFGKELEEIIQLRVGLHRGKGRYIPLDRQAMHIVALGSGVGKFSSTMESFLSSVLDTERGMHAPDVVLLSETPFDEELVNFVQTSLPPKVRGNVHFLVGSAMSPKDLARARLRSCGMAFVIPHSDTTTQNSLVEDGQNILRALELKRYRPRLQLRLMLLQPESKMRAMNIGIEAESCFACFEQKINLIAQSTRVKGFLPLMLGLLQVMTPFHYREALQTIPVKGGEWMKEYVGGLRNTIYGFVVRSSLVSLPFHEAVAKVYKESDGIVLIIAAQEKGHLTLNFNGILADGQVVIAIAANVQSLRAFADDSVDWRLEFLKSRDAAHDTLGSTGVKGRIEQLFNHEKSEGGHGRAVVVRKSMKLSTMQLSGRKSGAVSIADNSDYGDDENEERMDRGIQSREAKEAARLRDEPSLITLVVAGNDAWQQVVAFLRTLRQNFLPTHQPVIVLSNTAPPASVVEVFEARSTAFLVGSVLRVQNLMTAGVQRAQSVVILNGEPRREHLSASAAMLADHDAILLANTVEQLLAAAPDRERIAIYEFRTTNAVRLVDHVTSSVAHTRPSIKHFKSTLPPAKPSRMDSTESEDLFHVTARRSRKAMNYIFRLAHIARNVFVDIFSNEDLLGHDWASGEEMDGTSEEKPSDLANKLVFQRRFAAGQAFTPDFFGSVLGHIYHFPTTFEFVEAMTMPLRRGQSSYPWQVQCPTECVGQTFGDLSRAWLIDKDELETVGPVLILAIYKRWPRDLDHLDPTAPCAERERSVIMGYNVTLPHRGTLLCKSDLLTVLAGKQFGQVMAQKGLLRGSDLTESGAKVANPMDEFEAALPHSMSIHSMSEVAEDLSVAADVDEKIEL